MADSKGLMELLHGAAGPLDPLPSANDLRIGPGIQVLGNVNAAAAEPQELEIARRISEKFPLSPILIADGECQVIEVIRKMISMGTSAALIAGHSGTLEGIFTDRDPFLKLAGEWPTTPDSTLLPVRRLMSRGLLFVEAEQVHVASELISERGIRHVPVVVPAIHGKGACILGMVTMQSIFRENVEAGRSWRSFRADSRERTSVAVISEDRQFIQEVLHLAGKEKRLHATHVRRAEMQIPGMPGLVANSFHNLLLDVDGIDLKRLGRLLLGVHSTGSGQRILLTYSPDQISAPVSAFVTKLSGSDEFRVLPKPIEPRQLAMLLK